jgi:hypothetical protein
MRPKMKVFIAYAKADYWFASHLVRALKDKGVEVLFDASNSGSKYLALIQKTDACAHAVVAIVSESSLNSPWFQFELGTAIGQERNVLPIYLSREARDAAPRFMTGALAILADRLSVEAVAGRLDGALMLLATRAHRRSAGGRPRPSIKRAVAAKRTGRRRHRAKSKGNS